VEGNTSAIGNPFTVRFGDTWVNFEITEMIPNQKIVWQVMDSYLPWLADKKEWNDTRLVFELSETAGGTQLSTTHIGLTPQMECFDNCRQGWDFYAGDSLRLLITEGMGKPGGRKNAR
jgi:Activator of Hsp90 ATPase homolog 1-like protein